jgi:hypothetical protein
VSTEYRTAGGEVTASLPRLQLFFGFAGRLGGELDLPFVYRAGDSRAHGVGDLSASLKWLLLAPEGTRPAVALGLELGCPTGDPDRETGEGTFELEPFVALLTATRHLTFQGNVAWSAPISGASGESAGSLIANLSTALPLLDQGLHLMTELSSEGADGSATRVALSPGVKCRLGQEAFVALAWPIGVTSGAEGFGVVFQLRPGPPMVGAGLWSGAPWDRPATTATSPIACSWPWSASSAFASVTCESLSMRPRETLRR